MPLDFPCNQGNWLDTQIVDRFVNGGICHAISVDWAAHKIHNNLFNLETARFRGVSGQRAYKMSFEHRLQNLWAMPQYMAWLAQARPPTLNFARSCLRGQAINLVPQPGLTIMQLENAIGALPLGHAIVIVMWGSDPNQPASGQNWGHTVAVARVATGFLFFDANQGQFSWPAMTPAISVAQQVSENLHNTYHTWHIRDFDIYTLS